MGWVWWNNFRGDVKDFDSYDEHITADPSNFHHPSDEGTAERFGDIVDEGRLPNHGELTSAWQAAAFIGGHYDAILRGQDQNIDEMHLFRKLHDNCPIEGATRQPKVDQSSVIALSKAVKTCIETGNKIASETGTLVYGETSSLLAALPLVTQEPSAADRNVTLAEKNLKDFGIIDPSAPTEDSAPQAPPPKTGNLW